MPRGVLVARSVTGVLFLAQLVLGIVFWTGHALSLTSLHMAMGLAFVLSLWTLAGLSRRAGAPTGPVVATIVMGVLVLVVGMVQRDLLPGPMHWTIRVLHLLLAMAAMAFAGRLTMSLRGTGRGRGDEGRGATDAGALAGRGRP